MPVMGRTLRGYRPTPAVAIAVTALVVAGSGVAVAAIPGGGGEITGCYAAQNGLLGLTHSKGDTRIIDETERCRSYEKTLTWSERGPQGPSGPQGATGPPGPAVAPAYFLAGMVDVPFGNPSSGGTDTIATLDLPAGRYAITAAFEVGRGAGVTYDCLLGGAPLTGGIADTGDRKADTRLDGAREPTSLASIATLTTAGSVTLRCTGQAHRASGYLQALSIQ